MPKLFSKEWFDKYMHPDTPDDIRKTVEYIVRTYDIQGICDPGHLANVIAMHTGRGNGQSVFWPVGRLPNIEFMVGINENIWCDGCDSAIIGDDAVLHVHTAKEFGGDCMKITHVKCADKIKREE